MSGTGQVLSADAIAALVDAARESRVPAEAPAPPPQRRRRMRAVDFTRPTKFTSEQERRLKRSLEAFCRTASTRLAAELRVPFELEVINSTQLTWANAHAQVPATSITGIVAPRQAGDCGSHGLAARARASAARTSATVAPSRSSIGCGSPWRCPTRLRWPAAPG